MAGQFDVGGQFPMDAVIQALQRKPVYQQQIDQQNRQDLLNGIAGLSQGIQGATQNVTDKRRRMAAAMTLSQAPSVQDALGANQPIPGTGSINAAPTAQLTSTPYGPVTPGMTANGATGQPVLNTPDRMAPQFTPQQIEPLLPQGDKSDYFSDVSKLGNLQALKQRLMNNNTNTVITQDADGNITGTRSVAGAHRPTVIKPNVPRGGGAGRSPQDVAIANAIKTRAQLASAVNNSYGPARSAAADQLNQFDSLHPGLGIPKPAQLDPAVLQTMQSHPPGSKFTMTDGSVWHIDPQSKQPIQDQ